ncbi:hypothetical protein ACP70R_024792 [Stipagrostis hirtigluma subsp. patula]
MGLSRRFLNLIMETRIPGAKSMHCIDLKREQFFNSSSPQPPNGNGSQPEGPQDATSSWAAAAAAHAAGNQKSKLAAASKMEKIQLPSQGLNFRAATPTISPRRIDCFPLADRRVLCADQSGRSFLFDAKTNGVLTMPDLHKAKFMPVSLFVPSDDGDRDGGSLFVMESRLNREPPERCGPQSSQFEAFVYRKPTKASAYKSWNCELLQPPPFVRDTAYWSRGPPPRISAYTVVGGGSHVCVSVDGAGTYCFDTASYTWTQAGEWTLPFVGKVEYVPELKLWFGLSAKDELLAAADLSAMDSQPQLVGAWKEFDPPEEWKDARESQFVSLGSGRFCVARFLHTRHPALGYFGIEVLERHFTVLTGVEVVPLVDDNGSSGDVNGGNGRVKLRMITHKSKRHMSHDNGTIEQMF